MRKLASSLVDHGGLVTLVKGNNGEFCVEPQLHQTKRDESLNDYGTGCAGMTDNPGMAVKFN